MHAYEQYSLIPSSDDEPDANPLFDLILQDVLLTFDIANVMITMIQESMIRYNFNNSKDVGKQ